MRVNKMKFKNTHTQIKHFKKENKKILNYEKDFFFFNQTNSETENDQNENNFLKIHGKGKGKTIK